ncbi:hypothetical protein A3I99_02455 [Candidatus Kaiserbacteria bacterium RIFCSPLOWO2_02_FULL_45_11b]|uniref:Uncharacterized protein n=1 Tax=Candidatus Kaiserbacteria bacterium RIFCSPLOWO2_12_FULL_45_26 TaxID=1798525 RepID=A0A1F6FF90_9BACT|nr:MAG: hypothetical protein A2Z56_01645 [Candidatus Kaiserbacteria bacterium RIFCSPHIGHO2_12_45_16]OGG70249.1 MAG: hypothetical protein A2929_04200 [Candidatus Kaiserbacteria bacterium RIFCSPLOWO2_01_FULL_45_25]OGG81917.1 MAG: hypothetical protein A3I99_02455 [Candidatus Kaiserbacteria bacterium RIFCSPLOWO2_02_FULL_45_11b]OGG84513.1 MAG: hypothetical protein A3G90_00245 [Candidatus Kaiserbacteria bacterium RIFCSPLOWO2_12_FULL_45_26]
MMFFTSQGLPLTDGQQRVKGLLIVAGCKPRDATGLVTWIDEACASELESEILTCVESSGECINPEGLLRYCRQLALLNQMVAELAAGNFQLDEQGVANYGLADAKA